MIAAKAKYNLSEGGGDRKSNEYKESGLANLPEAIKPVNTRDELSSMSFAAKARERQGARNDLNIVADLPQSDEPQKTRDELS